MKLADYLYQHGITPKQFQQSFDIKCRSTAFRYLNGERRPNTGLIHSIHLWSGGKVSITDFYDPKPANCIATIIDRSGRTRHVLPWSTRDGRLDATLRAMLTEPPEGTLPSDILQRAVDLLGPRVRSVGSTNYLLDGRPTDSRRLIEAANTKLVAMGLAPMRYPGTRT